MALPNEARVPRAMQPVMASMMEMIEPVCRQYLDDEYLQLCRALAAALARKRPSPLARGETRIWACAIVYAMGTVNFLFDKTQTPHLRSAQLCELFGVKPSTASAKAGWILKLLNISRFDPRWTRPSKIADNPLAWMIQVNGLIVDARHMPREIQQEAFRKGLIPYLPLSPEQRN